MDLPWSVYPTHSLGGALEGELPTYWLLLLFLEA